MKKRILSLLLTVVMVIGMLPAVAVAATGTVKLSLTSATAKADSEYPEYIATASLVLNIDQNPGLASAGASVTYDKNALTLIGLVIDPDEEDVLTEMPGCSISSSAEKVSLLRNNTKNTTKTGMWATLIFGVKSGAFNDTYSVVVADDGFYHEDTTAYTDVVPATGTITVTNGVDGSALKSVALNATTVQVNGTTGGTVNATATSVAGATITNSVDWSVAPADQGVSVNASGVVTVDAKAKAATYTVTATPKTGVSGTAQSKTFTVTRTAATLDPTTIKINTKLPATVTATSSLAGEQKLSYDWTYTAKDQYGDPYPLQGSELSLRTKIGGYQAASIVDVVSNGKITLIHNINAGTYDLVLYSKDETVEYDSVRVEVVRDTTVRRIEIAKTYGATTDPNGYSVVRPTTGENTLELSAEAYDKYEWHVRSSDYTVTWGGTLLTATGVTTTTDDEDITIKVSSTATPGDYTLTATSGGVTESTTVTISEKTDVSASLGGLALTNVSKTYTDVVDGLGANTFVGELATSGVTASGTQKVFYYLYKENDNGGYTEIKRGAALSSIKVDAAGKYYVVATYEDDTQIGSKTSGTFTVGKTAVTVTPKAGQSKTYGTSDPTFGSDRYTVDIAGTVLTKFQTAYSYAKLGRAAGEDAGEYAFTLGNFADDDNFTVTLGGSVKFTIAPKSITPTVTVDESTGYFYTGSEIKPHMVTVKDGSVVVPDSEYTLGYSNNINAGTNTGIVTVSDKEGGNYTFTATNGNFTIRQRSINNAAITITVGTALTYTGAEQTQTFTVKDGSKDLTEGTDYTVQGTTNKATAAGEYTLTIEGKGNYTGTKGAQFTVAKKAITPTVAVTSTYSYTGSAITPTYTVKDGETALTTGDYEAVVSENINAGSGKITVTAKENGNYSFAEKVQTFAIAKAAALADKEATINLRFDNTDAQSISAADLGVLAGIDGAKIGTVGRNDQDNILSGSSSNQNGVYTFALKSGLTAADKGKKAILTFYYTSTNYEESKVVCTVTVIDKNNVSDKITFANGTAVYNGAVQKHETAKYDGQTSANFKYTYTPAEVKNVGTYSVDATYEDADNYGTKTVSFTITKATPTGKPEYKTVGDKKTLADAELKVGTITPAGTIAWVDDPATTVEMGKSYKWVFTPSDTTNYNTLEGSAVLYPVPYVNNNYNSSVVKNPDGSVTTTVTDKATGTVTSTTTKPDGTTIKAETKADGTTTAKVVLPAAVPAATVNIPVTVGNTTVAKDAATGKIIKMCAPTANGLAVLVESSVELIIANNSKTFTDVHPVSHWATNAVDFVAAREVFGGTSLTEFSPNMAMSRAMLWTVLARMENVDTSKGATWYEAGKNWAVANGISDGTNADGDISREQLATMLYRYAGSPEVTAEMYAKLNAYPDAAKVNSWAKDAMAWAVSEGLINGVDGGLLSAQGSALRCMVATIMMRYITNEVI